MNVLHAVLAMTSLLTAPARAVGEATVDYGLFGTLHLTRPADAIADTILFFSDRDGWSARQQRLAAALAARGAFVVGIDLPAYLQRLDRGDSKCSYPAGHVEEVAHWIERHEGLADYSYPLVVGDGDGATFAYALTAQAPKGTFAGLITLGWDDQFRMKHPMCPGDAGEMTAADGNAFRVVPVADFPAAWIPAPFAPGARASGLLADARAASVAARVLVAPDQLQSAESDLGQTYARWRGQEKSSRAVLPDDIADLPISEIAPTAASTHQVAIILTGDGGWAGLDRGVADALTAHGVRVIGFSTLKFFWHKQSADAAAQAVARVIAHYAKADPDARFVLIGYSFGASLVPVVANRLPDDLRALIDGGVLISPDDEAVFEIHVGDWFGSTHHDDALPIGPEMQASKIPLVCVHGVDEDDSFCLKPQAKHVTVVALPGGHHYDGDFAALGALIVKNLPSHESR